MQKSTQNISNQQEATNNSKRVAPPAELPRRIVRPIAVNNAENKHRIPQISSQAKDKSTVSKAVQLTNAEGEVIQNTESDFAPSESIQSVADLKKITEILPYFDFEPNLEIARKDPCQNLCPRPDGKPCSPDKAEIGTLLCPKELALTTEKYEGRFFEDSFFHWEASNISYNPLYFEDVQMERYGHTYPAVVQPFVSVAKFGTQLVGLPYQMSIDPIRKKVYPLGYYRPGEAAPRLHYQIPLNAKAAVTQAGVMTGLIFLIP